MVPASFYGEARAPGASWRNVRTSGTRPFCRDVSGTEMITTLYPKARGFRKANGRKGKTASGGQRDQSLRNPILGRYDRQFSCSEVVARLFKSRLVEAAHPRPPINPPTDVDKRHNACDCRPHVVYCVVFQRRLWRTMHAKPLCFAWCRE